MKDVAEYLRWVTPFFNDTQRYKVLSWFHVLIQIVILIAFFFSGSLILRIIVLLVISGSIITELYYRECILSLIEREFSSESWDDILDDLFERFDWKLKREEKVIGFTCFNIGIFLMLFLFTIYDLCRK
jgi:hypothetical protein